MSFLRTNDARPDYYISPTRDFTQYTQDYERKYWSKDTAFDWTQNVTNNLRVHLEGLPPMELADVTLMTLPMVDQALESTIIHIRQQRLPLDEDALNAIAECIPSELTTIQRALAIQSPLTLIQMPIAELSDRLDILKRELSEVSELKRLGLFKSGTTVKQLENEAERKEQASQLSQLNAQIERFEEDFRQLKAQTRTELDRLRAEVRNGLDAIEPMVLMDLEETRALLERTLNSKTLPTDSKDLSRLQDLVLKRQVRGLKDIANHALVVEQSAIAPLTMGIIHYKRHREIQEAMTTFVNDEAKHSAVFRRFLVDKLGAKEHISYTLIKGSNRYMWLAQFMPSGGMFLAVIVEAIGGAYLEFFGIEHHMPDPLFRSICKTISERDERRHMDLCAETYNELYRTGSRWERFRNMKALKIAIKSAYGDKNEDHHLVQAFRAFGVVSESLYQHITSRLSQQLARIGVYASPETILGFMGLTETGSQTRKG